MSSRRIIDAEIENRARNTHSAIQYSTADISTTGTGSTRLGITVPSSSSIKKRPRNHAASQPSSCLAGADDLNSQAVINEVLRNIHPREYAESVFRQNGSEDFESIMKACKERIKAPTPEMLEAYVGDIVIAIRNNDLQKARLLYEEGKFGGVNACNRFGESILHIACRRGHIDMVEFLVLDVGLSISEIRDDYHRTPLHDAFWTPTASYDVVDFLLKQPYVPDLLLCKDRRGFTPLDYTRAEDRGRWVQFLWERKTLLRSTSTKLGGSDRNEIKIDDLPSLMNKSSRKRQRLCSVNEIEETGLKIIV